MTARTSKTMIFAGWVVACGAAWWLAGVGTTGEGVSVPEEFAVSHLQETLRKPGATAKLFSLELYRGLRADQREQARANKKFAYEQMWQGRIDAYFEAGASERERILDRHIDDFLVASAAQSKSGDLKNERLEKKDTGAQRPMRSEGQGTREQRKAKSESIDPDRLAQTMAYKSAFLLRMESRGIKPPY